MPPDTATDSQDENGKPRLVLQNLPDTPAEGNCHLCTKRTAFRHYMAGADLGEGLGALICSSCTLDSAPALAIAVESLNLLRPILGGLDARQAGMVAYALDGMAGTLTGRDLPPAEPTPAESAAYLKAVQRAAISLISRHVHGMTDVPVADLVVDTNPFDVIEYLAALLVVAVEAGGADPLEWVRHGVERLAEES